MQVQYKKDSCESEILSLDRADGKPRQRAGAKNYDTLSLRYHPNERKIYVPPLGFATVADGIYRSGHPITINFPFLERLQLKTIIFLGEQGISHECQRWADRHGIKYYYFCVLPSKEPFTENNPEAIRQALQLLLDKRHYPVLVHSNKGKHRVGVLVGAMRRLLQGWSLASIFEEYGRFSAGKEDADLQFIEFFTATLKYDRRYAPDWLEKKSKQQTLALYPPPPEMLVQQDHPTTPSSKSGRSGYSNSTDGRTTDTFNTHSSSSNNSSSSPSSSSSSSSSGSRPLSSANDKKKKSPKI